MPFSEENLSNGFCLLCGKASPEQSFALSSRERRHFKWFEQQHVIEFYLFGTTAIVLSQLSEPVNDVIDSDVHIVLGHFRVKLSDINELIFVVLLIHFFMPFEDIELLFQVFADLIKPYLILVCIFIEAKDDILYFFLFAVFVVLFMAPSLVLFKEGV